MDRTPGDVASIGRLCDAFDFVFRKTRSGNTFSPWAPGTTERAVIMPLDPTKFDFDHLVQDAVTKEMELDDDDTEGYSLDPATLPDSSPCSPQLPPWSPFSSPMPLSPVPDEPSQSGPSNAPASIPSLPPGALSTPMVLDQASTPPPCEAPKYMRGSAEDILRKNRGKLKRAIKRLKEKRAAPYGLYVAKPSVLNRHVWPATAIKTAPNTTKLRATKNGWTGARDQGGYKCVFTLGEMVGEASIFKFRLERWDSRTATPIIDSRGRVIGVCAGHPDDPSWDPLHKRVAREVDTARDRMNFGAKDVNHRRMADPSKAVPGMLLQSAINAAIFASLLSNTDIIRIAGFASACFATWAPNLFTYYVDHLRPLYEKYPHLKRNFRNSIFACATFNFGPFACSYDHTDPGNLPFGWCAITALGPFDPT
ncbi:hypothetical protein PILCRDRAFT_1890 [Piloderma croceum F 1598]|uniref:Uncharacterized protein n=1 Tax=Piloderma croceum (strain F 1598) TaxID=765440 RepID=A0A0C3GG42_PILCF|nr:hypothetical protein PILCRDRAFT_1890 [Piloderma croceum F 1598]